jgi:hypothetical protein
MRYAIGSMVKIAQPVDLPREGRVSWWSRLYRARPDLLAVIVICLGAAVATRAFWQSGVASEWDMLIGIYRLFELDQSWGERIFFPRIAMGLNFGYSGPLFQYYPPLASYVALVFRWLGFGWIGAVKAGFTLALLLAGIGAYVYARWLFVDRRAAFVAGFAYLLAPYLLLNVYERGANAELLALGLLPWVFWSTHHILASDDRVWVWTSAGLIALLILAHNITALFVMPLLIAFLWLLAWHEGAWRRLLRVALAVSLGLCVSAFYWLPAVAERSFSHLEAQMLGNQTAPIGDLRKLGELFQPSLAFDFWGAMRFHPALWQGLALGAGALAIALGPRRLRFRLAVIAGALVILCYLQSDLSRAFWQIVPLVRFIQFPWRLLGLLSFFTALLLGALLTWRPLAGPAGWIVAVFLVAIIGYAGLRNLDPRFSPHWLPITDAQIGKKDLYARGAQGYPLYTDYTPASIQSSPQDLVRPRDPDAPIRQPLAARPTIRIQSEDHTCLKLDVQSATPMILRLPRVYFPNWQISVSGQTVPAALSHPLGLITVEIPAGEHPVEACFVNTPLRIAASAVSVLALMILIVGGVRARPNNRIVWAGAVLVVVLAVLTLLQQDLGRAPRQPVAYPARFEDELDLLGYQIEESVLQPGDTLNLRLYWLADKAPDIDYKVFVHLSTVDDSSVVTQIDEPPLLGQGFTTRWDPGELIIDEHQIPIAGAIPPGTYRILIGIYRPDTVRNLQVTGAAEVWPGDRLALAPVTIRGK